MNDKLLKGVTIVFDVDDTICNNNNRDYENALPYNDVINKINDLYSEGANIVLYTSRGMVSCNGDIKKIIEKNKAILEKWLEGNNVKYNELIFGKPIADMYIDDKAMNVREFINQKFDKLSGHSGYPVIRLGNIVKKEMSEDNYNKLMDWYKASEGIVNNPSIISNLYTTVYIEYIEGVTCDKCLTEELLNKIINQALDFKEIKYDKFNISKLLSKLEKHKSNDSEWNNIVDDCKSLVSSLNMGDKASLSHSDYTLVNMVVDKENKIWLLDSLYDKEASSYLLDLAKLKMSLDGYEYLFCGSKKMDEKYNSILKTKLKEMDILNEVNILEYMYAVRLYNYNEDKEKVKEFVKARREEIE